MSILKETEIQRRLKLEITDKESLVITPRPRKKAFDYDSVDLRLGCHFLLPQVPPEPSWGSAQVGGHSHTRIHVPLGSYFVVPSHETVLGVTLEFIKLPSDLSGQILTKSSVARCFMVIETAPWIHPLYRGKRHFLAALFWGCSGFKLDSWWLCGHGGLGWMKG